MLCDICHTRQAKIFYTEIINGNKREQHLCEECASEATAFSIKDMLSGDISIENILSGILSNVNLGVNQSHQTETVCARCGRTLSELLKTGKLGCPECYNAFADIIDKNLKNIQGAEVHQGKEPMNAQKLAYAPYSLKREAEADPEKIAKDIADAAEARHGSDAETPAAEKKRRSRKKSTADEYSKLSCDELKSQLKLAVASEDYELAAKLRDMIRAAEGPKKDEA